MIRKIIMKNMKGLSEEQKLSGRDIITGKNGAGKTTRLQAMSLAMMGYVPGIDKKNSAIFELSSDKEIMEAGLQTDDLEFTRTYKCKEKLKEDGSTDVSFSQSITLIPNLGERTNTQKEQSIMDAVGNFSVMLDFGSFINMTDMQQRDFIYKLSGNSDMWTRDYIIEKVREQMLTDTLQENNPEMYEVMVDNVEDVTSCYLKNLDMNKGLLAMVERAKSQHNYWKQEKTKAESAAKKLAEMKNSAGDTDRDLNANMLKREDFAKKREELVMKIAKYTESNQQYQRNQTEIADLEEQLEKIDDDIVEIDEKIAGIREKIEENSHDIKELEERIKGYKELASDSSEKLVEYMELHNEIYKLDSSIAVKRDLVDRMSKNGAFCCIDQTVPCNQNFEPFIQKYNDEIALENEKMEELIARKKELDQIAADREKVNRSIDQCRANINSCIATEKTLTAEIEKLEVVKQSKSAGILTARIEKLKEYQENNPYVILDPYVEEQNKIDAETVELDKMIDVQKKQRATLASIRESMIDSDEANFQVLTWKQIVKCLGQSGIQGEIVKNMLDPIKDAVSEKLRGLSIDNENIPSRFFFSTNDPNGKEWFRFGWINMDGEEIPFSSLSQGEQMMLLTALMVVIIEKNNPKLKVLAIDDLNHLDKHNMQDVISGLLTIGENMDNIILSGVIDTDQLYTNGWTVTQI